MILTEKIGEVGYHGTEVCLRGLCKSVTQVQAIFPDDGKPGLVRDIETSPTDNDIQLVRHSILCDDTFLGDLGNSRERHIALFACNRLKVSVARVRPLLVPSY